jgi:putative FmdB family regulatory protein
MPLYEYQCHRCGSVFEVLQKFSDRPLSVHEGCGGPVGRLLSPPALKFKGSGWYVTDYAQGSNGKSGGADSKPKTEAGDSKPPAKKESSTPASSSDSKA